ncbi:MAG TPA: hypothetical protein VFE18_19565 [Phenylobacterium sp.]|jgi:hypothetical protein|uniref:hypothetical protein n=1 Tax=Phenylobacterium sp. TaxID=1871053 RepID=UPI002D5042EA|nr:hypothetical protein [Phenylobacterium sp.]HZZ70375.1 hypothetical protein [Phenylobacterium sp.]
MSKSPKRRLKVFQAQFGFHDTVLAVSSQAEALRVWGTRQNLFAEGLAKLAEDRAAIEAALAHPGTPLRRPVGSNEAFELEPGGLPKPAESTALKTRAKPADRSSLTAAERALEALEDKRKRQAADLRRRRDELAAQADEAGKAYTAEREAATAKITAARAAYRKAGGED